MMRGTTVGWLLVAFCAAASASGQQAGDVIPEDIVYQEWNSDTSAPGSWPEDGVEVTYLAWVSQRAAELALADELEKIPSGSERQQLQEVKGRLVAGARALLVAADEGSLVCSLEGRWQEDGGVGAPVRTGSGTSQAKLLAAADAILHVRVVEVRPGLSFPLHGGDVRTGAMVVVQVLEVLGGSAPVETGQRLFVVQSFGPLKLAGEQLCSTPDKGAPGVGEERVLAVARYRGLAGRPLNSFLDWSVSGGTLGGRGAHLFPRLKDLETLRTSVKSGELGERDE